MTYLRCRAVWQNLENVRRVIRWLKQSEVDAFATIVIAATILMIPAFITGHIVGHSSILNVNWSEGFARQLASGDIYPRWLPEMNAGGGSPVFYFYGPLPFYLTAPFFLLTDDPKLAVVFSSWLLLAASGCACFLLCRHYAGKTAALIAALYYLAMPYHYFVDVWIRAALGEQAAFVLMPLASLCALRLRQNSSYAAGLALSYAGLAVSHLPSTLLFTPVLVFLVLLTAYHERSPLVVWRAAIAGLLGLGASCIYLLPAWFGRQFIQPEHWAVYRPAENLLFGSETDNLDPILVVCFLAAILVFASSFSLLRDRRDLSVAMPWAVIATGAMFFVSSVSQQIWANAGLYQIIQFPWRLLSVLDLATCVAVAIFFAKRRPGQQAVFGLQMVAVIVVAGLMLMGRHASDDSGTSPLRRLDAMEERGLRLKVDASEYLPSCISELAVTKTFYTTDLLLQNRERSTQASIYPIFYFPFLRLQAQGKSVVASCDLNTGFYLVQDSSIDMKDITISRVPLPVEWVAWSISGLSALFIAVLGFLPYLRRFVRV